MAERLGWELLKKEHVHLQVGPKKMGEGWGMVEPLQPQRETQGERNHQLGKAAEKASPVALAKRGREPKRTG